VSDGVTTHHERYQLGSGDTLTVQCHCRLGGDHKYVDWLRLPENAARLTRANHVWATTSPPWSRLAR
jgi:hypothetical protein